MNDEPKRFKSLNPIEHQVIQEKLDQRDEEIERLQGQLADVIEARDVFRQTSFDEQQRAEKAEAERTDLNGEVVVQRTARRKAEADLAKRGEEIERMKNEVRLFADTTESAVKSRDEARIKLAKERERFERIKKGIQKCLIGDAIDFDDWCERLEHEAAGVEEKKQ